MKTPEEFRKEKEEFPKSTILCEKLGHYTTDDLMKDYAEYYHQEQVKKLNIDDVSNQRELLSFMKKTHRIAITEEGIDEVLLDYNFLKTK